MKVLDKILGNSILRNPSAKKSMSRDEMAKILKVSPQALKAFEDSYRLQVLDNTVKNDDFFSLNAKQIANDRQAAQDEINMPDLCKRIVQELLEQTQVYSYDGISLNEKHFQTSSRPVTLEEIIGLPKEKQPQLTGTLVKRDIQEDASGIILFYYQNMCTCKDPVKKKTYYDHFRQGLDILDLDPITYEMIGNNPNSFGNWFPQVVNAVKHQSFFKLPKTTFLKVPLPLLQLIRLDYFSLTAITFQIVNEYCNEAFGLDEKREYFIKTGTYSSKYDFRNAKISGAKEVREIGEYLLFIHFQALQMASPLCTPSIYGVSTTNEWVVREYIPDTENNPTIYKGLPLHTEYRFFVDFDSDKILGVNPYWDPEVMKKHFSEYPDADEPHQVHDDVTYRMHEEVLMERYENNISKVTDHMEDLIPYVDLTGQWSVDIMQNGEDFYIIDMALAKNSALNDCVPKGMLRDTKENWIPKLSE